jgi:hypothetical protein
MRRAPYQVPTKYYFGSPGKRAASRGLKFAHTPHRAHAAQIYSGREQSKHNATSETERHTRGLEKGELSWEEFIELNSDSETLLCLSV